MTVEPQTGRAWVHASPPRYCLRRREDRTTPLKCLLSRSIKGKDLITYQNLVSEDYAQKNGKSRTIANKFGMYWYVTRANEFPRLGAENFPGLLEQSKRIKDHEVGVPPCT